MRQICQKNGSKSGWFHHHFSKVKLFFSWTSFFPTFLYLIRFMKLASKLNFKHWKCLVFCRKLFASVMDKGIFFYQVCNKKPETTSGLKNTGKHWQLVYVRTSIYENRSSWLVLEQYFFKQLIFLRGRWEFHHWRSHYKLNSQYFILQ